MELVDIFKIVLPVIVALCGTVWGTMRWTLDRQSETQKEYWKVIHEGLAKQINDLGERHETWRATSDDRVAQLEKDLSKFREKVAEEYIKRQDWLEHAVNLERKVDQLRADVNRELQALVKEVSQLRGMS